jgi:hypothetical protein
MRQAVADWIAKMGQTCMGYKRPRHRRTTSSQTMSSRVWKAGRAARYGFSAGRATPGAAASNDLAIGSGRVTVPPTRPNLSSFE